MHRSRMVILVFGLLFVSYLSSCSGDGDTTPSPTLLPAASAEGLWIGTTSTNNSTHAVAALVLDHGVYGLLYSGVGKPSVPEGFIQGNKSGTFISSDAKDFNLKPGLLNATIDGSYIWIPERNKAFNESNMRVR